MTVVHSLKRLGAALLMSGMAVASASGMSFQPTYVDGRPGIVAVGQITMDTPSEFAAVPVAPGTQVYLNSPGGNVGAAVSLGNLFRSRGVTAVVAGVTETGVSMPGACYTRPASTRWSAPAAASCPGAAASASIACRPPPRI